MWVSMNHSLFWSVELDHHAPTIALRCGMWRTVAHILWYAAEVETYPTVNAALESIGHPARSVRHRTVKPNVAEVKSLSVDCLPHD
jgi:hypothetical protein